MNKAPMSKITAPEITSYAGGVASIGASLTLTEVGVIVGIVTALLTFAINAVFMYRRDRREERALEAQLGEKP
jgi:protein-S-isoprenylcysteine O-methyltransferase Ste14